MSAVVRFAQKNRAYTRGGCCARGRLAELCDDSNMGDSDETSLVLQGVAGVSGILFRDSDLCVDVTGAALKSACIAKCLLAELGVRKVRSHA